MCRKQELRVLLVITTTGSEAGHVLHQANVRAGFKKIRISLLQFCKCFKAEVNWQSLNRNCECHSLATVEFPLWPVNKFDIQTKRNIPSVTLTPLYKTKNKREHPDFKSKTTCMSLKFHCITFPKNSILLATIVLLFLTKERICKQDNPKIFNPVLLMGL